MLPEMLFLGFMLYLLQQLDTNIRLSKSVSTLRLGTKLARSLREFNPTAKLIFLSSSNEFATESFAVDASFYLLKPLTPEKLETTMARYNLASAEITVDTGREVISINPQAVMVLEMQNKYTLVRTVNGLIKVISPLSNFADLIQRADFLMTNRSFVINLQYVDRLENDRFIMKDGFNVPITIRNIKAIRGA
ncbi:MAG: response regulator transcription factor [Schwartzia sp.]|nr:response regulator transcription factor [Schwartzia sp. (in: firmicutes)]